MRCGNPTRIQERWSHEARHPRPHLRLLLYAPENIAQPKNLPSLLSHKAG